MSINDDIPTLAESVQKNQIHPYEKLAMKLLHAMDDDEWNAKTIAFAFERTEGAVYKVLDGEDDRVLGLLQDLKEYYR